MDIIEEELMLPGDVWRFSCGAIGLIEINDDEQFCVSTDAGQFLNLEFTHVDHAELLWRSHSTPDLLTIARTDIR